MPDTNQFAKEYEEIQERFSRSPYIKIVSTEGDPPQNYEIEYCVKGLSKDDEGRAVINDSHSVNINLPFGYPHFPPNCKPNSPIFHPDFDPDAVCIGDYWNADRTLADLIEHIGKLITFQAYSVEDVFNGEALQWVRDNADQIPLEKVDFTEQLPPEEVVEPISAEDESLGDIAEEIAADSHQEIVTPAKPRNLKALFGVLGVVVLFAVLGAVFYMLDVNNYDSAVGKWKKVATLVEQKNYQQADTIVKEIESLLGKVRYTNKAGKTDILEEIKVLQKSEIYAQGVKGNVLVGGRYLTKDELRAYNEVNELLAKSIEYEGQSMWQLAADEYSKAKVIIEDLGDSTPMSLNEVDNLLNKTRFKVYVSDGNIQKSNKNWDKAITNYEAALKILEEMNSTQLSSERHVVQKNIQESLLLSRVEFGDQLYAAKKWGQSASTYNKALKIARSDGEGSLPASKIAEIEKNHDVASFNDVYEAGSYNFRKGKWDAAIKNLLKSDTAWARARKAGGAKGVERNAIKVKILQAAVNRDTATAEQFVAAKQFVQAAKDYQKIVSHIDKSSLKSDSHFIAIRKDAADKTARNILLNEVQIKTAYLLSNYVQIFKDNFSSAARSTLSNPTVDFIKQEGGFLVFRMECVEQARQQRFKLQIDYQYDQKIKKWSARRP